LIELWTDPGVSGEVGPVAPAADDAKGLAAPLSGCDPVIVDSDRLPLQLGPKGCKILLWDVR